jgi:hypothetical protein
MEPAMIASESFEVAALQEGERLVLWGLRMIANGRAGCMGLRQAFADTCGSAGEDALIALFTVTRYIGHSASRPLMLSVPGCPRLSRDERILLDLFGAAQQAADGGGEDGGALDLALSALIDGPAPPAATAMLKLVARALTDGGAPLLQPRVANPVYAVGRTLH